PSAALACPSARKFLADHALIEAARPDQHGATARLPVREVTAMRIACLRATMMVLSALAFIVLATAHGAGAQEQGAGRPGGGEPVTVGVHVSPPFVMKDGARFVGMAVELWEELAARLQRPYTYREYETFGDLVRATEAGEVDLAVSNLTV